MTENRINSVFAKSKGQVFLEYVLLAVCLCIIALRSTYTEGPSAQLTTQSINLSDTIYSLSISVVLILAFAVWLAFSFCSKKFIYRFSAIEIGLFIFCIAALISGLVASNKRTAITNFVTLLAPILMVILLIQILDSWPKIKLLLVVIAASGVVSAYLCTEQFFSINQVMIDQYEKAPETILEPLGIQPGTLNHMLFEHRLYSKDVRGFFTTGNSAGSFAILTLFAALALFIDKFKNRKFLSSYRHLIASGIALAAILFGLCLTGSKGAITALFIAVFCFIALFYFGSWLKKHKIAVLTFCLLFFFAVVCMAVMYGLAHNRLPGGNSMLVRWQYWHASAKMYADHFLAGVGPGNFTNFYSRYKPAEALETVADPHNYILSVLTQYGPLGLVGFLAFIAIPLWRLSSNLTSSSEIPYQHQPDFKKLATIYAVIISIALLIIRPIIIPITLNQTFDVIIYVIFTLYIAPIAAFLIGFLLITTPLHNHRAQLLQEAGQASGIEHRSSAEVRQRRTKAEVSSITIAALFCAVVGILIHNLIDFAIFEPGIFTAFCATIASLIALDFNQRQRLPFVLKPPFVAKLSMLAAGLVITCICFYYVWWPVTKVVTNIKQAAIQQYSFSYQLLRQAALADPLNPQPLNLNGQLYLRHYEYTGKKQPALLKKAEQCFLEAIERDHANYKNYENLSTVYDLLGRTKEAYDFGCKAAERYPGSAQIQFHLAQIAEKLHKTDTAIEHYKNTVDIEDSFRRQFRMMYPDRESFSRLGQKKYKIAKQKIKQLTEKQTP